MDLIPHYNGELRDSPFSSIIRSTLIFPCTPSSALRWYESRSVTHSFVVSILIEMSFVPVEACDEEASGPPEWARTGKEHTLDPVGAAFGILRKEKLSSAPWIPSAASRIMFLEFNVVSRELE